MPCGTKLSSNKKPSQISRLTTDNLEYKFTVEQEIAVKPR